MPRPTLTLTLTLTLALGAVLLHLPTQAPAQERGEHRHAAEEAPDRPLVAEGVRVWTRQCIRCHNVRVVWERRDRSWATIMAHMRARANLTRHQAEAVLAFLRAVNEPAAHEEEEAEREEVPECPAPTPERAAEGAEVYRGEGNCIGCHGAGGRGAEAAPPLSDGRWSHISGTYPEIVRVVTLGAPGMPPMGGAELTDAEVCAVSAYVYSISR